MIGTGRATASKVGTIVSISSAPRQAVDLPYDPRCQGSAIARHCPSYLGCKMGYRDGYSTLMRFAAKAHTNLLQRHGFSVRYSWIRSTAIGRMVVTVWVGQCAKLFTEVSGHVFPGLPRTNFLIALASALKPHHDIASPPFLCISVGDSMSEHSKFCMPSIQDSQ